jgi:hypothetical protein
MALYAHLSFFGFCATYSTRRLNSRVLLGASRAQAPHNQLERVQALPIALSDLRTESSVVINSDNRDVNYVC